MLIGESVFKHIWLLILFLTPVSFWFRSFVVSPISILVIFP